MRYVIFSASGFFTGMLVACVAGQSHFMMVALGVTLAGAALGIAAITSEEE